MKFVPIDMEKHRDLIVSFRLDSFIISFGVNHDFGDGSDYVEWVKGQSEKFPDGFVLLFEHTIPIGQLELSVKEYEGRKIGYVHLYYLVPGKRGAGMGVHLHQYALDFFTKHGVKEFHLRVAPSNERALKFYDKIGLKKVREEHEGKVIRMVGYL